MWAKSTNFLAVVESCQVGFSEDIKSLSYTQFACFGHRIEGLPPVQDFPAHFVCWSPCLGQRATLQSSDQNMQTLCSRKIFHLEKASSCKSKPSPRNWNFLPTHQEFSFEEYQESESAWLVEKLSQCLTLFVLVDHQCQYLFVSWGLRFCLMKQICRE